MVRFFDDDQGLHNIVSSCNEVMQLSNQLVAKTEQYLKHFSVIAASDDGTTNTFQCAYHSSVCVSVVCIIVTTF